MRIDPEQTEPPMTRTEEKQLFNAFSDAECADTFHLAITKKREEPGRLFSQKALEQFLHTFRLFIGGRILGRFNETGKSPEVVVVHVRIEHLTKEEYDGKNL